MKGIVKASFHITAALVLAAMTGTAAQAETEAEFYKGKRIRINIGFPTGGTSDIFARTLARHMGRHLPAKVTFVPQNQPGAGGLKSANYLYNVAPPGLSSTRAKTLQNAFNGTIRDPKFVQDAEKQGLEVDLLTGEETLEILKKLYATPKAIVERARAAQK